MFGFLRRRCGDADLAADLTQDTFVRAWRAIGSFAGDAISSERLRQGTQEEAGA